MSARTCPMSDLKADYQWRYPYLTFFWTMRSAKFSNKAMQEAMCDMFNLVWTCLSFPLLLYYGS